MSRRKVKLPARRAGLLRFLKERSKLCDTKISCLAEAGGEGNDAKRCFAVEYIGYSVIIFLQLVIASARLDMEENAVSQNVVDRASQKWAAICHLSALIGLLGNGIGFFLAPLIVWLVKRQDNPFIDEQGKEAVNFQITMLLAAAVSALLMLVLVGFILIAIVGILMVVFPIIAAVKASEGEHYRYPISIRLIT